MADRTRSGRRFAGLASIRARLTAAACLVVAGALLVGAVVILTVLRHTLDENLDDAAVQRARDVAAQVQAGTLDDPLPVHGDEDAYIDIRAADGHAVARTSNLKQDTPVATFRPEDDDPAIRTQKIPVRGEEDDFRIVALNAQGTKYGAVTIYVVASLDRVKETATAVRHLLRWGVPLLVALVGAIAWFVVGRALRPVESMRAEVAEITAQDLDRRVPVPAARRRDRAPRDHDERHARPIAALGRAGATVRRRRVPRAAEPARLEPGRPRGGARAPGVDGVGGDGARRRGRQRADERVSSATSCSSPRATTTARRRPGARWSTWTTSCARRSPACGRRRD